MNKIAKRIASLQELMRERVRRFGSFYMWMIWRMPVYFCWRITAVKAM